MSCYLVELYSPNATWKALRAAERKQFLDQIQTEMGGLSSLGIEMLAMSDTDRAIDQAGPHQFLGVWRLPDRDKRDLLLGGIKASGWYNYFDQVNAACDDGGVADHMAALARI